ncbi:MAG TPA: hypothetical protein VEL79_15095 [Vicinamibacterales bacterium]|nr:hypothetical protein [Vicinamibacterales bacterium]
MQKPGRRSYGIAAGLLWVLPSWTPTLAQKSGPGPIHISFRASTDEGQQVSDLKPDEISLKVGGKARQIQSLTFYQAVALDPATGRSGLPAPYASNAVGRNGRVIHLLIDDDSIAPGRETDVQEAVRQLTTELVPGDRIGVLTTEGQVNLRPADDPAKIRLAVGGIKGRASASETPADAQCRTTRVLADLGTMLAMTGGTPTTLVIFSAGLSPPVNKIVQVGSRSSTGTSEVCPVRPDDFQNIGNLASTANADLYFFHLVDAMATTRSVDQDAGVESLAGVTGGELVRLSGNAQTSIARLLRETAGYYVTTFTPEPGERGGQMLRVDLRATRDNVKLRTRPAVDIPKDAAAKAAASPKDMLRTAAEYRDLPLRATAYTSRLPGTDEVKVVALFDTVDGASLASASIALFDEKNTLKKQWTAQAADFTKRPVIAALSAPPGAYRMRVAAVDASGRAGTADYQLAAELPRADPLKLSTLVLGTRQEGGSFQPRMAFTTESVVIGVLEIYGVPKGGNVAVNLDVASTSDGAPLATADTNVSPGNVEDMRVAFGGFSIENLQPGDYLMRAVVTLDGKAVGRVVRTLRKTQ